jgi:ATP-dependent Lhr-like helicase
VLDRKGSQLRVFDPESMKAALVALAADFHARRVFYGQDLLVVKKYPKEAEEAFKAAGFSRQMMDYCLWRVR